MRHSPILARTLLTLTGVGLPALLAPATAAAQQKVQYACYVPGSGTVYRVKEANTPAKCGAGHVEFQISDGSAPNSGAVAAAAGKPGGGGSSPSGPAGGDLGGSYPDPSVVELQGQPISAVVPGAGQVLTFSNGAWQPQNPGAATLPKNAAGAFDFSNQNGFVSVGTGGVGSLPVSGNGTRFMWYPAKHALRAGNVQATQWDDANIGVFSTGLGASPLASGASSVAMGNGAIASGNMSLAVGDNSKATGEGSTALGGFAQASGFRAVAAGASPIASGMAAVALGQNASATGPAAVALGFGTFAGGLRSTALGDDTQATGDNSTAMGSITRANGASSTAMGRWAHTGGRTGSFVYGDASTPSFVTASADNQFVVRAQRVWFGTTNTPSVGVGRFLETSTGAYLTTGGTWTNSSDVNRKHEFQSVDGEQVLERLAAMPVSTWSYREEDASTRHMGPTAQDFRAAFNLGDTDKAIATVDADGVSLAAIKALVQRTAELRRENDTLRAALADLQQRLAALEAERR